MTAEIAITSLTLGSPKATDVEPAVDTTDTTMASTGTTKKYIRSDTTTYILGLLGYSTIAPVRLATTGALTATYANGAAGVGATLTNSGALAALSIDSVAVALNDRILVKNQAAPAQNGIYTVTTVGTGAVAWVLTRATDWDVSAEMANNQPVAINLGTVNNNKIYISSLTAPVNVGTDAINFVLFNITASLISPLPLSAGGTNAALVASNGAITYCTATAMAFSAVGSVGQVFQSNGAGAPTWSTPTYPSASGALGKFLQSDGTNNVYSAYKFPTAVGANGTLLYSNGTDYVTLATANSSVLVTTSAGVPVQSGTMTNGQLIIGSTGATPAVATLTAGTGMTISNGAGTITLNAVGGGFSWTDVTGTTQAMAVNNGYIADNAGLVTLTLPATAAIGDSMKVMGKGAGGWTIAQNVGQTIHLGSSATTAGVGGSLSSTNQWDVVEVVCVTANTTFSIAHVVGNITVV